MPANSSSSAGSRRRPAGASQRRSRVGRSLLVLFALLVVAVLTVVLLADLFQKGIQEVTLPLRHENVIRQQSEEKGVDAALIAAVIYSESRFNDQTSDAGARGLMQITPETAKEIEKLSGGTEFVLDDLSDPELNIRYGTFYLRHLLDQFGGDQVAALAAYNAGPGNAVNWGGSAMTLDDINYEETRAYVKAVLEKRREYRHIYDLELGY
ncbi:MAG: lytic transglycosylase domain-containing protein [Solirubrobacterales bacterium]|nr:lytic transglycosylase domain-containing protein [Solirubrobacterales bacterium]